jgi:hypothetical protein
VTMTVTLAAMSVALTAMSMSMTVTVTLTAVPVTVAFVAVTFVAVIALTIIVGVGRRRRRRRPRPIASAGVGAIRIVTAPAVGEPAGTIFLTMPSDLRRDLGREFRRIFQAAGSGNLIIRKVFREGIGLRVGRHAQGDRRRGSKCCNEAFHCIS